jgi:hypothetical protein
VVGAVSVGGLITGPLDAECQFIPPREGQWQFSIPINFVGGEQIEGEGGSALDMNDDVGWGFAFGYHVNNRFMVGFESTWLTANYDATIAIDQGGDGTSDGLTTLGGTLEAGSFMAVGQFNVIETGRFSPFIQGKLGTTYADSNIPSAPAEGVCWWDPWWGYVCDVWQPTFSSWSFAYGGALGLRAQLGPQFFLEGSYNLLWVDLDQGNPSFDGFRLNIGWSY